MSGQGAVSVWPAAIMLWCMSIHLGLAFAANGQPQPDHSFVRSLLGTLAALGLLWWGGFFDVLLAR